MIIWISLLSTNSTTYLKGLQKEIAARSIQGLALTEANYAAATEILKEWFGRKQQIISGHMDDLLTLKPAYVRLLYLSLYLKGGDVHIYILLFVVPIFSLVDA